MSLKMRRMAFVKCVKRGMTKEEASTVALALFPWDTNPQGTPRVRAFTKEIRRRAKAFARESRSLSGPEAREAAIAAIADFCRIAHKYSETYYVDRFCGPTINPGLTDDFG